MLLQSIFLLSITINNFKVYRGKFVIDVNYFLALYHSFNYFGNSVFLLYRFSNNGLLSKKNLIKQKS